MVEDGLDLQIVELAAGGVEDDQRALVDNAVEVTPHQQFHDVRGAAQRSGIGHVAWFHLASEQVPAHPALVGAAEETHLGFGEVRGDTRVDRFDLARLTFEGDVQLAPQKVQVGGGDGGLFAVAAGELGEEQVGVAEAFHQGTPFLAHLLVLPLTASVETAQHRFAPPPFGHQALHEVAAPAPGAGLRIGESRVHFDVEAAPDQLQEVGRLLPTGMTFQAVQQEAVGVEDVGIGLAVVEALFEFGGQQAGGGEFLGVSLQQGDLEERFVGGGEALVQLPQGGAEELAGGDAPEPAQVDGLAPGEVAGGHQARGVVVVVLLVLGGDEPPQGVGAGEPHAGAVELVQEEEVLGAAAVFARHRALFAGAETGRLHDEKVDLQAEFASPALHRGGLLPQGLVGGLVQAAAQAQPHVQVAAVGEGNAAGAAHEEHGLDVQAPRGARLAPQVAQQALGGGEGGLRG